MLVPVCPRVSRMLHLLCPPRSKVNQKLKLSHSTTAFCRVLNGFVTNAVRTYIYIQLTAGFKIPDRVDSCLF